jgi:hypothetical protein
MRWEGCKKRPDDFRSSDLTRVSCDRPPSLAGNKQQSLAKIIRLGESPRNESHAAATFKRFIIIIKRLNFRPTEKDGRQRTAMNENRPRIDYSGQSSLALRLYFVRDDNAEMRDRREIKARAGTVTDTE